MSKKSAKSRRALPSQSWFGRDDRDAPVHRSWMKNQGFPHDRFDGRPVIVAKRKLHLHVSDAELACRRAQWKPPKPHSDRGWAKLYCATVTQADEGVDLDFLVGKSGAKVGRPSH